MFVSKETEYIYFTFSYRDALQTSKVRKLQHYFPDFGDEFCAEILEGINWDGEFHFHSVPRH